jgi:hypothetical protein
LPKIHKKCAPARPNWVPAAVAGALLAACNSGADVTGDAEEEESALLCGDGGHLSGQLYGAIETRLDRGRHELECTGMPRPDGKGIRLRLATVDSATGNELVFIIAMPGFERGSKPGEFDTNITLIESGNGRFFSTPDTDNCLVDVAAVEAIDESGERYEVSGALYCVSPVPEVNGNSSVSIPELRFAGLLDWTAS